MRMEKARFLIGFFIVGSFLCTSVSADIIWSGAVAVDSDFSVPIGETLMVEPNTLVQVDPGVTIEIRGRILAQGTDSGRIQFILTPGQSDYWNGIHLVDTTKENILSYVDVSGAESMDGSIGLNDSRLLIEYSTLSGGRRRLIYTIDSSLHVRHCYFPDRFGPDETPDPTDDNNVVENIKGSGILAGGEMIIENNLFGTNKGHNDLIDFSGPTQPGPILRVLNNVFLGGGDECMDLGGDAYIEGNLFMHIHKDPYNTSSGQANVISTGDDNVEGIVTCVRNIFYDIDYVIDLKKDTYLYFINNLVARIPPDSTNPVREYSAINFVIPNRFPPGKGAHLKNNIFWDIPNRIFSHVDEDMNGDPYETDLEMHYCLVPTDRAYDSVASRPGTIMELGQCNRAGEPLFADPNHLDFHLRSQGGRWDSVSQSWVLDTVTSIAIDAGDTNDPINAEPFPNGGLINLGAYGGTTEAGKSYFDQPPCTIIIAGDINGDCIVNLKDFALLAHHWLEDRRP